VISIAKIKAREILDSRGFPTVEVDLTLSDGSFGRASVPSGASTGSLEAIELRDGDVQRYLGKGVIRAVNNVINIIAPRIINKNFPSQSELDHFLLQLDGTNNKSYLGANAVLAVSLSFAKAMAAHSNILFYQYIAQNNQNYKMPNAMMNVINGGMHADNKIEIQEFMIVPNIEGSFAEKLRVGAEVFHNLKRILHRDGFSTNVGDEGGFAPMFNETRQALDYLCIAIEKSGFKVGSDVLIALDCAASEFYKDGNYSLEGQELNSEKMIEFYKKLLLNYPLVSIEDPMAEDDDKGWKLITREIGDKTMLVGDDLFVTNPAILSRGISENIANSILIKPNQIGTLTETLEAIQIAQDSGYKVIISHRSGETEDTSIAHIAVAVGADFIKTGSLSRTDRVAKYNELIRIAESL
jgi:enolase